MKRRPQFTIASLLALMTVCSVLGSFFAVYRDRCERQQRAIDMIRGLGGKVSTEVGGPDWLGVGLRRSFFRKVFYAQVAGSNIGDDELSCLGDVAVMESLEIRDTALTDAGLGFLNRQSNLHSLSLSGNRITDEVVAHLASNLELVDLDLSRTAITDAAIERLPPCPSLLNLHLNDTAVTDRAMGFFAKFAGLLALDLAGTRITDAGLVDVMRAVPSVDISVERTHVTDRGILQIGGSRGLKALGVGGSMVTAAGLAEFQRLYPNVMAGDEVFDRPKGLKAMWPPLPAEEDADQCEVQGGAGNAKR